jgi:hypothetical protein
LTVLGIYFHIIDVEFISELDKAEKAKIRERLLLSLGRESDSQLHTQVSVLVARIARFDFPQDWPNILAEIFSLISGSGEGNYVVWSRYLFGMNQVCKSLVSKTLPLCRKHFSTVAPALFESLFPLFCHCVDIYVSNRDATSEQSLLCCLKVLYRLVIFGSSGLEVMQASNIYCY